MLNKRQYDQLTAVLDELDRDSERRLEESERAKSIALPSNAEIHIILCAHPRGLGPISSEVKQSHKKSYRILRTLKPKLIGIEGVYIPQHYLRRFVKFQYSIWKNLDHPYNLEMSLDDLRDYYEEQLDHFANLKYAVNMSGGPINAVGVEDRKLYIATEAIRSLVDLMPRSKNRTDLTKKLDKLNQERSEVMFTKMIEAVAASNAKTSALPVGANHGIDIAKFIASSNLTCNFSFHNTVCA